MVLLLVSVGLVSLGRTEFLGVSGRLFSFSPVNASLTESGAKEETTKRGVVIVTAVSVEKLEEFKEVDGFYEKIRQNRRTYAEAHGIHLWVNYVMRRLHLDGSGFQ